MLADPGSRALYLFPTKALSRDQQAELHAIMEAADPQLGAAVYDGDTPPSERRLVRDRAHVILSNPDMLHTAILPHHARWMRLFENLKYVVIDELHTYRGVFGSHLANVLRRLRRICRFHGSNPTFICTSATIANAQAFAERLLEQPVELVDDHGAPLGERHFVMLNPPVVNPSLGLRAPYLGVVRRVAAAFLEKSVHTIVFCGARTVTEVMTKYLKEIFYKRPAGAPRIVGYRGGYLPKERRGIERGLREGSILGVVSTNALELGVDIGALDACVLAGYPGTVASTRQQAGRAGRRQGASVAVLVLRSHPLDQYLADHPEFLLDASPESAHINPDNLQILASHLKCAAFELPVEDGERFAGRGRRRGGPGAAPLAGGARGAAPHGGALALGGRILPRQRPVAAQRDVDQLRRGGHDHQPPPGHRRGRLLVGLHDDPRGRHLHGAVRAVPRGQARLGSAQGLRTPGRVGVLHRRPELCEGQDPPRPAWTDGVRRGRGSARSRPRRQGR